MVKEKVVKIDSDLFNEVDDFLSKGNNNLRYSSKKQFVDIAVLELLNKEKNINHKNLNQSITKKEENKKT